jgi:hypothetical protein
MTQATNGKWYLYVVDDSVATLMDGDDNGLEFGVQCTAGIGTGQSSSADLIVADSSDYEVWANAMPVLSVTATTAVVVLTLTVWKELQMLQTLVKEHLAQKQCYKTHHHLVILIAMQQTSVNEHMH